jgi:hypothetical protein
MPVEGGDGSTLSLDFTTGVLDPRLTFTRSTNATFINSQGLVQFADANLLQRSQDYTVAAWSKFRIDTTTSGLNTANTTTAPDGTSTGLLLKSDGVSGTHRVLQSNGTTGSTALSTNGLSTVTLSAYFKANGSNFCSLKVSNNIESRGVTRNFNLTDGVVSGAEDVGWTLVSASASPVGNGWYRCQMTVGLTRVDANDDQMGIWLWVANGPDTVDRSFTNSAASVWVWGAQVSIGANALEYRATTTAPYQAPRFDYDPTTLAPRGLLVEGQAVNLLCWSESFATSGGTTNWGLNGNSGATVTETNPAGGSSSFQFRETSGSGPLSQTVTTVSTSPYTFSFWVRASVFNSVTTTQIQVGIYTTAFQTVSISKISGPGSVSGTGLCTVSGLSLTEWTKIQLTTTGNIGATSTTMYVYAQTASFELDRSLLIWGAQLEAGSGASSYIPTGASTATRAYDHCYATGANFTSWFSTGAGTVVAVSDITKSNTQNLTANISDGTTNNYVRMGFKVGGASNEYLLTTVGGPSSFQGAADSAYAPPLNTVYKMAYAWDTNNFAIVANGGSVATDTAGSLAGAGVLTQLVVGGDFVSSPLDIYFKNGHIRSLKYYPTRLPNAQLQSLTT